MVNEIIENIRTRRSIRAYQDEQIKAAELEAILEAAQYAPSGSNNQSWLFSVVQSREVLTALNEAVRQGFLGLELEEDAYPAKRHAKKAAENASYNFYYNAPTLVIVSNRRTYPNAMADSAAALENIFLAAHSMGIGSCWINQLTWLGEEPSVREVLTHCGIPIEHIICGAAALGYAKGPQPKAAPRKENTVQYIL